jgi:hypothetical protein
MSSGGIKQGSESRKRPKLPCREFLVDECDKQSLQSVRLAICKDSDTENAQPSDGATRDHEDEDADVDWYPKA